MLTCLSSLRPPRPSNLNPNPKPNRSRHGALPNQEVSGSSYVRPGGSGGGNRDSNSFENQMYVETVTPSRSPAPNVKPPRQGSLLGLSSATTPKSLCVPTTTTTNHACQ